MTTLTTESMPEFIGQIIDLLEDYLTDKEIILENEDREDAFNNGEYDDPKDIAIIYGCHYGIISDAITDCIERYELMTDHADEYEMERITENIMQQFRAVLIDGGYKRELPENDVMRLESEIATTFINWNLTC